jgi:uncharacterized protein (DUF885 family)
MTHTLNRSGRVFIVAIASVVAARAAGAPACYDGGNAAVVALRQLFDDHQEWRKRESPEYAMRRGDYRYADRIGDDSLAAIQRRHADTQAFLARLRQIDRAALPPDEQLNYDLFDWLLGEQIEGHRFRMFLAPIGGRFGPQQQVPQMHERVRFDRYDDYVNYLTRLEQVPRMIDENIELLRLGLSEGRTPPQVCIRGVSEQFTALLADGGGLTALAKPLQRMPASISEVQRTELQQRFAATSLPAVHAAITRLADYFNSEYFPNARQTIAATALPDGDAFYAFMLRRMTTTDLTAGRIHEIGLAEVVRIRTEMLSVIRGTDFMQKFPEAASLPDDELFRRFIRYLRTDPRFYHASPQELLAGYRDTCKRIDAELPRLFRVLPRLPYGVREIPAFMAPHQTTAYYSQGDIRNAEPGYFYANTYALDQRPRYEMISLAMHEAVPGHHLQVALAQELDNAPDFRQDAWFTAFGEGWALYSERLGLEVGLYADPYDNFGRLLYEMWRACRLVVDPGMHALGWSREQAVAFMLENTALSELNINNEIDRYINWPGQATAYKIGELKIRELRARAEAALGDRFDRREFHNVVLGGGAIPLTVLEKRVDAWITAGGSQSSHAP